LVGFGEDGNGQLLLVQANQGTVHRIVPARPCDDGLDNDGDGLTDFPADPGCKDATGLREEPQCDDGLDNDGDGRVDWDGGGIATADPQCAAGWGTTEEGRRAPPPGCGVGPELSLIVLALWCLRRRISFRPLSAV